MNYQLQKMYNSKTWKLTRPLRAVKSFFTRGSQID